MLVVAKQGYIELHLLIGHLGAENKESRGKICFGDRGLEPYSQRLDVLLWPLGVTAEVELTLVQVLLTALEVGNGKPEAKRSMQAYQLARWGLGVGI